MGCKCVIRMPEFKDITKKKTKLRCPNNFFWLPVDNILDIFGDMKCTIETIFTCFLLFALTWLLKTYHTAAHIVFLLNPTLHGLKKESLVILISLCGSVSGPSASAVGVGLQACPIGQSPRTCPQVGC